MYFSSLLYNRRTNLARSIVNICTLTVYPFLGKKAAPRTRTHTFRPLLSQVQPTTEAATGRVKKTELATSVPCLSLPSCKQGNRYCKDSLDNVINTGSDGPDRHRGNVNVKNLIHRSFTLTTVKDNIHETEQNCCFVTRTLLCIQECVFLLRENSRRL